jgi:hypothetical protein
VRGAGLVFLAGVSTPRWSCGMTEIDPNAAGHQLIPNSWTVAAISGPLPAALSVM